MFETMQAERRFLIAYDGFESGQQLPPSVIRLARQQEASLVVMHAVPESIARTVQPKGQKTQAVHERMRRLTELSESAAGVPVEPIVKVGPAADAILATAVEEACSLVAVLEHPKLTRDDLGKTTKALLTDCPLPIWMVRSTDDAPKRIMAAVDVDAEGKDNHDLDHSIVETALSLGRSFGSRVWVQNTWRPFGQHLMRGFMQEPQSKIEETAREHESRRRAQVERFLVDHDLRGIDIQIWLAQGDPEEAIVRAIEELEIDCLVIGNKGRSGLSRLLWGNTVERVLRRIPCSILALKPDDGGSGEANI